MLFLERHGWRSSTNHSIAFTTIFSEKMEVTYWTIYLDDTIIFILQGENSTFVSKLFYFYLFQESIVIFILGRIGLNFVTKIVFLWLNLIITILLAISILSAAKLKCVKKPPSQMANKWWGRFNIGQHKLVLIEDFPIDYYYLVLIKGFNKRIIASPLFMFLSKDTLKFNE